MGGHVVLHRVVTCSSKRLVSVCDLPRPNIIFGGGDKSSYRKGVEIPETKMVTCEDLVRPSVRSWRSCLRIREPLFNVLSIIREMELARPGPAS